MRKCIKHKSQYRIIQGDQNVSMQLTITVQSSGAQRFFDHPVQAVSTTNLTTTCRIELDKSAFACTGIFS